MCTVKNIHAVLAVVQPVNTDMLKTEGVGADIQWSASPSSETHPLPGLPALDPPPPPYEALWLSATVK